MQPCTCRSTSVTATDPRPDAAPNSGAAVIVGSLILLIGAAALQSPGPMLASAVLFLGAVVYRTVSVPMREAGSERRHLALSMRTSIMLMGGSFVFFVASALYATR